MVDPLPIILTSARHRPEEFARPLLWQTPAGGGATGVACFVGFIILVVVIVVSINSNAKRQAAAVERARKQYKNSLAALKLNPSSPDLRQQTLDLGRAYSHLTRNRYGVSLFDERQLKKEVEAAVAGTRLIPAAPSSRPGEPRPTQERGAEAEPKPSLARPSIEERLARLAELRVQGLISEEEYGAKRRRIIDEI